LTKGGVLAAAALAAGSLVVYSHCSQFTDSVAQKYTKFPHSVHGQ